MEVGQACALAGYQCPWTIVSPLPFAWCRNETLRKVAQHVPQVIMLIVVEVESVVKFVRYNNLKALGFGGFVGLC